MAARSSRGNNNRAPTLATSSSRGDPSNQNATVEANMRYVATAHMGGPAVYNEPLPRKPGMGEPLDPSYLQAMGMAPVEAPSYEPINSPPPGYSN